MPGTCTGPLKVRNVCLVYSSARAPVTMSIVAMASAQHIVMRIRVTRIGVHSLMDDISSPLHKLHVVYRNKAAPVMPCSRVAITSSARSRTTLALLRLDRPPVTRRSALTWRTHHMATVDSLHALLEEELKDI